MKEAITIEKQIEKLKNRGLIIENESFAQITLSCLNYYRLTGYLYHFKNHDKKYKENLTFEKVVNIYEFDTRLRNQILYIIEKIEMIINTNFKSKTG